MSGTTGPTDGSIMWGYSATPPSLFHIPIPIRHTNGVEDLISIKDRMARGKFIGGLVVLISTDKLTKATPSAPFAMFDVMAS